MINITKGKTFKKCRILSCGLSGGVHPYGVIKRYQDYVIFDYIVRVIFEYRINCAYNYKEMVKWQVDMLISMHNAR